MNKNDLYQSVDLALGEIDKEIESIEDNWDTYRRDVIDDLVAQWHIETAYTERLVVRLVRMIELQDRHKEKMRASRKLEKIMDQLRELDDTAL